MSPATLRELVRKDLHLQRWTTLLSILAGLLALAIMPLGRVTFYVGSVSLVCVLIVANILLAMQGVAQERKDKVMLFVLGLPVSPGEYALAKILAGLASFGLCWGALTAATLVTIRLSPIPEGLIPLTLSVFGYVFAYFCVLLGVSLLARSEHWITATIIAGNVSVNFYIPLLMSLPSVAAHTGGAAAVWSPALLGSLALESSVCLGALALSYRRFVRNTEFV